jgi:hypothetical protein
MADATGYFVLTAEVLLSALVLRGAGVPAAFWIVIAVGLGVGAHFVWHSEKSAKTAEGWLWSAMGSVIVGLVFFACDVWVGGSGHASLSAWEAAKNAGGPFGFGLTLVVCPGLTFISIAGIARTGVASLEHER